MAPPCNPGLSAHSLTYNLTYLIKASETRTTDAQRVFFPIVFLWDSYIESDDVRQLPAYFRKLLAKLYSDITALTNIHFESYIKGIYTSNPLNNSQVNLTLLLEP